MNIVKIKISDTWEAPNWPQILMEYALEASIEGMPTTAPNKELYTKLEGLGVIHTFGAFLDKMLIGYITVMAVPGTHYETATIFSTESFFVLKEHRKTGAGLRLLRAAETLAKGLRAPGLLVSARVDNSLPQVLGSCGYKETNRVFFKRFE